MVPNYTELWGERHNRVTDVLSKAATFPVAVRQLPYHSGGAANFHSIGAAPLLQTISTKSRTVSWSESE